MYSVKKYHCKTYILPILVFLLGCLILSVILHHSCQNHQKHMRTVTELNAEAYSERLQNDINRGITITDSLEEIVISEHGQINKFQKVSEDLMTSYIQSIQIAPGGVVTEIYPETGNETGRIDLINDEYRGEICRYGRDNNIITMQGPFDLKQGGSGIAIRNPVYLEDENGGSSFWGFTIVIIRVPDIFAESVQALTDFGYDYCLSKAISPFDESYEVISESGESMQDPITYDFMLGCCSFRLSVMPKAGWNHENDLLLGLFIGLFIILLLTGLTSVILVLEQHRKNLKKISTTDPLTGLLNRKGFDERLSRVIQEHPDVSCVGIQLDIDDFKFINDMYGHAAGDAALKTLARSIKDNFPDNAVLCRNGGDEFSIILIGTTVEEARDRIEKFTGESRYFMQNKEKHNFYISVGYAEFPKNCAEILELVRYADMALYEVKLHGKHNCLAYRDEYKYKTQHRSRLGFALQDISENLPGAFLIYKADPEDDRILFANQELINLAGCSDFDDFLAHTDHRFRNLIRPDEQKSVEASIWSQINSKADGNNDYVKFHFARKDGSYHPVLDHGRIINSRYYGNVFYVLIMDCTLVESYYKEEEKISGAGSGFSKS